LQTTGGNANLIFTFFEVAASLAKGGDPKTEIRKPKEIRIPIAEIRRNRLPIAIRPSGFGLGNRA